ncbi:hypothetical protein SCLCIDRAFT_152247 [Scleroderma citrinum Foug A]|uniref:Uncharacterized protein n=1 Tax=Scleroderma citrinum Foug A TaxID=1036808 RepID=A0A0C3ERP0_9AGAM|nr:hypothetical protein SCLCIDRAFT_152247 [Scleroderma citrinum Foug A]
MEDIRSEAWQGSDIIFSTAYRQVHDITIISSHRPRSFSGRRTVFIQKIFTRLIRNVSSRLAASGWVARYHRRFDRSCIHGLFDNRSLKTPVSHTHRIFCGT